MLKDSGLANTRLFLRYLKTPKSYVLLFPLLGMVSFVVLYIMAALVYPGGSVAYPQQNGFNFWNNYLCDLLDEFALNGELNTARFYARYALTILCTSLLLLWFYLPKLFAKTTLNQHIMWVSGLLSLLVVFFLAAQIHDEIVRIAGVFGVIAFISSSVELYKAGYVKLCMLGFSCLLIFLVNYYIYETGMYLRSLPVIQKVTFVCCLLWFLVLNLELYKKLKTTSNQDL